ncbi:ribosome maturation factor RimP [Aminivibrio sp.]
MDAVSERDRWESLREIVEGLGYECAGIAFTVEEKKQFLRVYIDSIGGILVKDCETVSKRISRYLDEHEDLIPGNFYLEVSSPGLERPLFTLDDYIRFTGKKARLKTKSALNGQKRFTGVIEGVRDGRILFVPEEENPLHDDEVLEIPFDAVSRGNLVFEDEKTKRRNS